MRKKLLFTLVLLAILSISLYKYGITYALTQKPASADSSLLIEDVYLNKWKNKSWLTLGDSITKANGYQPNVQSLLGFAKVDNKGLNGQTMVYQKKIESTYTVGKNINYSKYDLVTIATGTNDFRYNKRIGNIKPKGSSEFDEYTFIGAYQLLIEHILSSNPNIDLVLITPLQRNKDGYDTMFTNQANCKLIDYVNAIKLLGEIYSLPVLDLYATTGITEITLNRFTRDGLHPNEAGYERISDKMSRFLLNI